MDSKTKANPSRTGKPPRTLIQARDLGRIEASRHVVATIAGHASAGGFGLLSTAAGVAAAESPSLTGAATMPITECDGRLFREALLGSLAWLTVNRDEVDSLNVFPVPHGDTGTNMLLTLQSAVEDIRDVDDADLSRTARRASHG